MLTAMTEAERLTQEVGQDIVVFTCGQPLYRVAVNISWAQPDRFHNMVLRLGGLHFLMSYIGCVGALMAERKWSGRHRVVCFWWCRSHDDRQEISTEFPCIATTCRNSNREDRAGNQ